MVNFGDDRTGRIDKRCNCRRAFCKTSKFLPVQLSLEKNFRMECKSPIRRLPTIRPISKEPQKTKKKHTHTHMHYFCLLFWAGGWPNWLFWTWKPDSRWKTCHSIYMQWTRKKTKTTLSTRTIQKKKPLIQQTSRPIGSNISKISLHENEGW